MLTFSLAAQAVVAGDINTLKELVQDRPDLVTARSPIHGATLLRYVGANGPVEDPMQKTPPNAVAVARLLLSNGAIVDATIDEQAASTPLVAVVTSEFPAEAGLQADLTELFVDAGAKVNGLNLAC